MAGEAQKNLFDLLVKTLEEQGFEMGYVDQARVADAVFSSGLDLCTDAERKVLEACPALPEKQLRRVLLGDPFRASHELRVFAGAELARRGVTRG
jgi:hypothetical protein